MTPGLAGDLRDPSFVLRIRRRICGLLPGSACPGSPGIRAAGASLQAGLNAGPHCDVGAASRGDAMPRRPFVVGAGNLRKPVGRVGLGGPDAGLVECGVDCMAGVWIVWGIRGNCMGILGAWGSARRGLQCMAYEMLDCGLAVFCGLPKGDRCVWGRLRRPTAIPRRSRLA